MRKLPFALAVLCASAAPAHAVDLGTIDRTVTKQPFTNSRAATRWVLLVFGPEAKTRAWVAVNGDTAAFDRNFNGDLTDDAPIRASNRTFDLGPITDPVTKVTYKNLRLRTWARTGTDEFTVNVIVPGKYEQSVEDTPFGDSPETAPIVHLDGPLTVGLFTRVKGNLVVPQKPEELAFYRQNSNRLVLFVGTPNHGKKAMPTCVLSCSEGAFAEKIELNETFYPKAVIELPNADPKGAPHVLTIRIDDD
jgi:hypothetical protein